MNFYIFDLDKTLLKINISCKYFCFLQKKSVFTKRDFFLAGYYFFKYYFFKGSLKDLHEKIFLSFLKGRKKEDIVKNVSLFVESILKRFLNKKVYSYLQMAKKEKSKILLLSSSPTFLLKEVAHKLKIEFFIGTEYIFEKGVFFDIANVMDGDRKKRVAKNFIKSFKIKKTFVFSDSFLDFSLFQLADKKFVVNPDKRLFYMAKKRGWEILL